MFKFGDGKSPFIVGLATSFKRLKMTIIKELIKTLVHDSYKNPFLCNNLIFGNGYKFPAPQNFYGGRVLALKKGGNDSDGVAGRWGGSF